jgi:hypothetical protein
MFDETSRYHHIETATYQAANGQVITYKKRRFLPQGEQLPLLVEVTLSEGDRLDLVAVRTIGDPQQFWRICDANNTMNPFALTSEVGRTLRVPLPQFENNPFIQVGTHGQTNDGTTS